MYRPPSCWATTPKGFNSTGEYEEANYHEELESIQANDLTPLIERHHALLWRAFVQPAIGGPAVQTTVSWRTLDAPTAKELADTNLVKAQIGAALAASGAISSEDERERVATDPDSGYNDLGLMDQPPPDDDDAPNDPDGMGNANPQIAAMAAHSPAVRAVARERAGQSPQGELFDAPRQQASDAGEFKEEQHPRAHGEFAKKGAGGSSEGGGGEGKKDAGAKSAAVVKLRGDELGAWSSMSELREKAMEYAQNHFIGKTIPNELTGNAIQVPKSGVKHTIAGSGDELLRTVPAIPKLIKTAAQIGSEPEEGGDPNIKAVETYEAHIEIDGKRHRAILTVKLYRDGRRYYDHGLVQ